MPRPWFHYCNRNNLVYICLILISISVQLLRATDGVPNLHIIDPLTWRDFDVGWCAQSFITVQDPIFPTIRRDAFGYNDNHILIVPQAWYDECATRVPELKAAAAQRIPILLGAVVTLVGRPFYQQDFDYVFYLCPYFYGGTAAAKVYPMFMYLSSAVGQDLQWPNWLFTDEYLFHETLHNYAMEVIDYYKLTPLLIKIYEILVNDVQFALDCQKYLDYPYPLTPAWEQRWLQVDRPANIGVALTHIHVYGAMTAAYLYLNETSVLVTIRDYECNNANPHPSYVWAWRYVEAIQNNSLAMGVLLEELKSPTLSDQRYLSKF
jgi:hypothetical protein